MQTFFFEIDRKTFLGSLVLAVGLKNERTKRKNCFCLEFLTYFFIFVFSEFSDFFSSDFSKIFDFSFFEKYFRRDKKYYFLQILFKLIVLCLQTADNIVRTLRDTRTCSEKRRTFSRKNENPSKSQLIDSFDLIEKKLAYIIIGIAFCVHNHN